MTKYHIPAELIGQIRHYAESTQESERDEAALIIDILESHFEQIAKLELATIAELDKITINDGMINTALSIIHRP